MGIGIFFLVLFVLIIAALPIGGVFSFLSMLPHLANQAFSDDISRVARTPIRKLGYNERFIRPIRELKERGLDYSVLMDTVGMMFHYVEPNDAEAVKLQAMLKDQPLVDVIKEVTGLKDAALIDEVEASVKSKDR